MSIRILLPALLLTLAGCATTPDDEMDASLDRMLSGQSQLEGAELQQALDIAAAHPLGSEQNPVRAQLPPGERAYLDRLRCADGNAPAYVRQGSGGPGPYGNIVDFYAVTCGNAAPVSVVMDMYHTGYVEDRPVPGFTIMAR